MLIVAASYVKMLSVGPHASSLSREMMKDSARGIRVFECHFQPWLIARKALCLKHAGSASVLSPFSHSISLLCARPEIDAVDVASWISESSYDGSRQYGD